MLPARDQNKIHNIFLWVPASSLCQARKKLVQGVGKKMQIINVIKHHLYSEKPPRTEVTAAYHSLGPHPLSGLSWCSLVQAAGIALLFFNTAPSCPLPRGLAAKLKSEVKSLVFLS